MAAPFRLIAWNIRAGGGVRSERIGEAIVGLGPDAVVLSEFRSTPPSQQIARALGRAGLAHQSSTTTEVARGRNALLLASREPLRRVPLKDPPRESGRWCIVRLERSRIVLGGMHVPNQHTGRKPHYHDAVLSIMRRWRGGPAIFAGDTNSGRQGEDEETPVFNRRTTAWFDAIHDAGWRDAFRVMHGEKREYTWYSPGHGNGFRLDQAFVSPQLAERIQDVRHLWVDGGEPDGRRDGVSDHAALVLDLDLTRPLPAARR